jgi:hypothetical protein
MYRRIAGYRIVVHKDLQNVPRIRVVMDLLSAAILRDRDALIEGE